MVKTYITIISLQRNDLLKTFYYPKGFELKNNRETSFPIIPIIANDLEEGDEVKVIAIRPDDMDEPDNYIIFLQELATLGIMESQVKPISVVENQSDVIGLKLLLTILDEIPEDSLVYTDITYGTKPVSAILVYAMNFIEKLKDSEVEGIYYGEVHWGKEKPCILHDLTAFKLLGDIIEQISSLEVNHPQEALHKLLDL